MFSFEPRLITRLLIGTLAFSIIGGSLLYSNYLATKLSEQETKAVELYAEALDIVANTNTNEPGADEKLMDFIVKRVVIPNNTLVPLIEIYADGDTISNNMDLSEDPRRQARQKRDYIQEFNALHDPIEVEFAPNRVNYVYYGESFVLQQLRLFPVVQLLVAFLFLSVVFLGFAIAKRNEQNRVWVGLAKETAHQLGTPVSSLMAWIELLKLREDARPEDMQYINEMERDVHRLEIIAERFSKIGSQPELIEVSLRQVLDHSANYLRKRMTKGGTIQLHVNNQIPLDSKLFVNPQLFDWVVENLLKNALDAIQSKEGSITLNAGAKGQSYYIDVEDTGKGIPKGNFKKIFEPGFTTKKRGWGLGLSLTKRIVENYHGGRIFVKQSEVDKGTTIRVLLPKRG
ncbi:MAG: HAMP domain-containing sensor histidine kinase [Bacteroidota bacterium]